MHTEATSSFDYRWYANSEVALIAPYIQYESLTNDTACGALRYALLCMCLAY
jgi:hypothetical protein